MLSAWCGRNSDRPGETSSNPEKEKNQQGEASAFPGSGELTTND